MAITNSRWHWRTTGWEKKEKKLQEEKSVKNTSSTCSIIRKMPQKPTESNLKICDSSISQNVRKLVVNREINSQVPLVAEPHRGDWGGYFWVTMRTLSACMHECLRQTEPTHLSNFCWISPHKWYLLEKWPGPVEVLLSHTGEKHIIESRKGFTENMARIFACWTREETMPFWI